MTPEQIAESWKILKQIERLKKTADWNTATFTNKPAGKTWWIVSSALKEATQELRLYLAGKPDPTKEATRKRIRADMMARDHMGILPPKKDVTRLKV